MRRPVKKRKRNFWCRYAGLTWSQLKAQILLIKQSKKEEKTYNCRWRHSPQYTCVTLAMLQLDTK